MGTSNFVFVVDRFKGLVQWDFLKKSQAQNHQNSEEQSHDFTKTPGCHQLSNQPGIVFRISLSVHGVIFKLNIKKSCFLRRRVNPAEACVSILPSIQHVVQGKISRLVVVHALQSDP